MQRSTPIPVMEIRRLHSEIVEAGRTMIDKAIQIGELLTEEKSKLEHGEWLTWLEEHIPFTRATAANYIRLYDRQDEFKCKTDLHLGAAYRLLALPSKESQTTESKPVGVTSAVYSPSPAPKALGSGPPPPSGPPSKAASAKVAGAIVDETGLPIPPAILPGWQRAEGIEDILNYLTITLKKLRQFEEANDTVFGWVNFQSAICGAEQAKRDVENGIPYAVCTSCQGKAPDGCALCKGMGFISKFRWGTVPEEVRSLRTKEIEKQQKQEAA